MRAFNSTMFVILVSCFAIVTTYSYSEHKLKQQQDNFNQDYHQVATFCFNEGMIYGKTNALEGITHQHIDIGQISERCK